MSDATKARRVADRIGQSRLLQALNKRMQSWMFRSGLIAFAVEPGGDAGAGTGTHLGGDAPAGGAAGAGGATGDAGGRAPAGDKPAADKPADGAKPDGQTADAKPEGDKPADGAKDSKDPKDAKPAGAPESYENFKLPEGTTLDEAVMGEFQTLAKEHGLTQEAAQKFVDLGARMQAGNVEKIQAAVEKQGAEWGQAAMADKEIGGEKFQENLAVARSALDKFGSPELKTLLVQSKLGNHPEVLRTFVRIGQSISQDGFVPGRQGSATKSTAEVLYSSTPSPSH